MRTITTLAVTAGAILLLTGCDVKDPIYNTSHPEMGTLTLTTDWTAIGEGLTAPTAYTASVGDYSATLSGTVNRLDHLFTPGAYSIYAYNTPEHVSVSRTTATVATATGNVDGVGGFVQSEPGWLFTSSVEVLLEKDADHACTAVMQQQVRELTLIIEPTGGTADRIESIEGYLTGAASSLNFADGTHTAPMNVEVHFARIADGNNAGRWKATVRLLGVAGAQQMLNAQIYFTDDNPKMVALESDLTTALAAFNADKRTPLTLGGSVVETPTGAGIMANITDWKAVTGGPVTAE